MHELINEKWINKDRMIGFLEEFLIKTEIVDALETKQPKQC